VRPAIIEADCSVTGESDSGSELVSYLAGV